MTLPRLGSRVRIPSPAPNFQSAQLRVACLPRRKSFEGWQTLGDLVESLLVAGEDRHLRFAKKARIVERADLQNDRRQTRSPGGQMSTAFGAEFSCYGVFKVAARKLLGRSFGIGE